MPFTFKSHNFYFDEDDIDPSKYKIQLTDKADSWLRNDNDKIIGVKTNNPRLVSTIQWLVESIEFNLEEGHNFLYQEPIEDQEGVWVPSLF